VYSSIAPPFFGMEILSPTVPTVVVMYTILVVGFAINVVAFAEIEVADGTLST
jgi:hypothetical protein